MQIRSALALVLVASACGGPAPDDAAPGALAQAIINGNECSADESPTAVALLVDLSVQTSQGVGRLKTVYCNGTVIAPDVVLTAAHCVDLEGMVAQMAGPGATITKATLAITFQPDLVALANGEMTGHFGDFPADAVEASHWIKQPDFTLEVAAPPGPTNLKDVGLVFLSRAVSVQPELIPTAEEAAQLVQGMPVSIAGWGSTSVNPGPGATARKMCGNTTIHELGAFEMQIGGDETTTRKCEGDSGGPTYAEFETTHAVKRRVIGITSRSYDSSNCAKGGLDTRADAWRDWIDATLTAECDAGRRAWCEVTGVLPADYFDPPPQPEPRPAAGSGGDAASGCRCTTGGPGLFALVALAGRRRRRPRG